MTASEAFQRVATSDWFDPAVHQPGLAPFPAGQKVSARRSFSGGVRRESSFSELRRHEIEAIERFSAPLFYPQVQEPLRDHEYKYQNLTEIRIGVFERLAGMVVIVIGVLVAMAGFFERSYIYVPLGLALMYAGRALRRRFAQISLNASL